jgi:hypothetical protein
MTSFYDVPGEAGYLMSGRDYGFDGLSFVLTETHPNGGPPLHTHLVEEAHVILSGRMQYVVGDQRFVAKAPFVARVPVSPRSIEILTQRVDLPISLSTWQRRENRSQM